MGVPLRHTENPTWGQKVLEGQEVQGCQRLRGHKWAPAPGVAFSARSGTDTGAQDERWPVLARKAGFAGPYTPEPRCPAWWLQCSWPGGRGAEPEDQRRRSAGLGRAGGTGRAVSSVAWAWSSWKAPRFPSPGLPGSSARGRCGVCCHPGTLSPAGWRWGGGPGWDAGGRMRGPGVGEGPRHSWSPPKLHSSTLGRGSAILQDFFISNL